MKKITGGLLVAGGVLMLLALLYARSQYARTTRVFSARTLILASWEKYKKIFINGDGRVIDNTQNGITTSEGQSYALLRAVWVDDKQMFDKVWKFTQDNLKRPKDNLLGWRWGNLGNGKFGFLPGGGDNSAADADSDAALALILANKRWGDESYTKMAKSVLADMWNIEVATAAGKNYLVAGNWAQSRDSVVINPSYFAPYAWRIFAQVDSEHDWNSLIDPAYALLTQSGTDNLDTGKSVGLPPDWAAVDKKTGKLQATSDKTLTTNYSFDAMRTPWRIAMDYQWYKDPQAEKYLKSLKFLGDMWNKDKRLPSSFKHNGEVANANENPAMYATALGYFMVENPAEGKTIYLEKIVKLYSNEEDTFRQDIPYYEQNWLWFGAALQNGYLSDFKK